MLVLKLNLHSRGKAISKKQYNIAISLPRNNEEKDQMITASLINDQCIVKAKGAGTDA